MSRRVAALIGSRWTSVALRGIASVLFGVIAFARPEITLFALALVFGAYAFVDGIAALALAVHRHPVAHRGLLVFEGLLGIGVGVITLLWPKITLLALVFLMGIRFVVVGLVEVAAGIGLRGEEVGTRMLLGLGGLASLLLGILIFAWPGPSAVVLVTILGIYAFVFGLFLLALAFRLRKVTHRLVALAA